MFFYQLTLKPYQVTPFIRWTMVHEPEKVKYHWIYTKCIDLIDLWWWLVKMTENTINQSGKPHLEVFYNYVVPDHVLLGLLHFIACLSRQNQVFLHTRWILSFLELLYMKITYDSVIIIIIIITMLPFVKLDQQHQQFDLGSKSIPYQLKTCT